MFAEKNRRLKKNVRQLKVANLVVLLRIFFFWIPTNEFDWVRIGVPGFVLLVYYLLKRDYF